MKIFTIDWIRVMDENYDDLDDLSKLQFWSSIMKPSPPEDGRSEESA
jgi:hypothetical protein